MRLAFVDVNWQFWYGRNRIPNNHDRKAWEESWDDNWHVWCGCPL